MQHAPARQDDPILWCAAITLAFLALALHRLGIPSRIYFDEVHYTKAARSLLQLVPANSEHPPFAKEVIAAAIALFGDKPIVWRLPSLFMGTLGFFAFGRAMWWLTGRRFATISAMTLVATGFAWFVQSRIAMLDIYAVGLGMTGLWQFAAAMRDNGMAARRRLCVTGLCIGLALASKWSIVPVAVLPGLILLAARLKLHGLTSGTWKTGHPAPGISLLEAAFWLGLFPLLVYWLTFLPTFFYVRHPVGPLDFIAHHQHMIDLQDSVVKHHPYQSVWYQWVIDWRPIWYLYENVDGAQRGVLMLGNPLTMIAGLPAVLWCLWAGLLRQRWDALVLVSAYAATLGLWILSGKPVLFYYHYLLPGTFLLGCLALVLDAIWQAKRYWRWLAPATIGASIAMFAWFYPILSAAPLKGTHAFLHWMWLDSWR
ncbi:MAG: phospholipid carrier-dependent glycosyltransferase [Novosphingobium sp.]|nr:phospholipid carrier-dependent glycosyltransferase [Novosphingobium sp.]